jgi:hypothetical protein
MKHVHDTWYLLVDGTHADPNDVITDDDGILRHMDGLAVAMRGDGVPSTIGVGAVENKNVAAAQAGTDPVAAPDPKVNQAVKNAQPADKKAKAGAKNRELKAGSDSKTYETR